MLGIAKIIKNRYELIIIKNYEPIIRDFTTFG